jgi:putative GTP pyrophosphokinase
MTDPQKPLSKSQIDKLGDRLKRDETPSPVDQEMLALYQASLQPLLNTTVEQVRSLCSRAVPGYDFRYTPRVKQALSVVAKLRRSSSRLSTIQDLVGFRTVVDTALDQEHLIRQAMQASEWRIDDRRERPSHAYRAVHMIRIGSPGFKEVQVRTRLQDQWAQMSEEADHSFPGVKYGQGPDVIQHVLHQLSEVIAEAEALELSAPPGMRTTTNEWRRKHVELLNDLTRTLEQG